MSFTPTQAGQYKVSVTLKGKHLQGSPFPLEVMDQPIYRRDYSRAGDYDLDFGTRGRWVEGGNVAGVCHGFEEVRAIQPVRPISHGKGVVIIEAVALLRVRLHVRSAVTTKVALLPALAPRHPLLSWQSRL